jgi:hypothetical protein
MLAKARGDVIARRAALSAPTEFLPRLLLCAGLPRASLVTMIDRLGKLGDASNSKDDDYRKLMSPSASSQWDIGRVGHRRDVARKLLGRLSAYIRLHGLSNCGKDSEFSTTFLKWLSEECQANTPTSKKLKMKKHPQFWVPNVKADPSNLRTASSILSKVNLQDEISSKFEISKPESALLFFKLSNKTKNEIPSSYEADFVKVCLKKDDVEYLDDQLHSHYDKFLEYQNSACASTSVAFDCTDLAYQLVVSFDCLDVKSKRTTSVLLKWVPLLSQCNRDSRLWPLLFAKSEDIVQQSLLDEIVSLCVLCWDEHCGLVCISWILQTVTNSSNLCIDRMIRAVVSLSSASSHQIDSFKDYSSPNLSAPWYDSKDSFNSCIRLAIDCAKQSVAPFNNIHHWSRHSIPPWLNLLLSLAGCSDEQAQVTADSLLQQLSESNDQTYKTLLDGALFRIYLIMPNTLNLGTPSLRTALVNAVESGTDTSMWPSTLDDPIYNMLSPLISRDVTVVPALEGVSRSHPLILLRKLSEFKRLLMDDATVWHKQSARGIIHGQAPSASLEATLEGRTVQVKVRHWGYSYTEALWIGLLDVVASAPKEILYTCGLKIELLDLLVAYVQLVSVQTQLRSANNQAVSKIKTKLVECFVAFQSVSVHSWRDWLSQTVEAQEVRHLLLSCDLITPHEAIESLNPANE